MMSVSLQHWSEIVGKLSTLCSPGLYHAFLKQATPVTLGESTIARPGEVVRIAVDRESVEAFQSALAGAVAHAIHLCVGADVTVRFVTRDNSGNGSGNGSGSGSGSDARLPQAAGPAGWPQPQEPPQQPPYAGAPRSHPLDQVVPSGPVYEYDSGSAGGYEANGTAAARWSEPTNGYGSSPTGGHTSGRYPTPPPAAHATATAAAAGAGSGSGLYPPAPGSPAYDAHAYAEPRAPRVYTDTHSLPINPYNTFENFIVGPSNRIAHAAAMAVSEHPGAAYNPLFLHGSVGLGKTHLLQAIALRLQQNKRGFRLLYISCETFNSQYINAMRAHEIERFQRQVRDVDCLIIDDIHFLAGDKALFQDEFFHTFNSLHGERKQIVMSSDSPPGEIPQLQDRLVSRFKSGLQTKIDPPEFETRLGILRQKAQHMQQELSDDILTFLAERFTNNVREIEGAIKRISAVSEQLGRPLALKDVRPHIADLLEDRHLSPVSRLTPDEIIAEVTKQYRVTLADLQSDSRQKHIALPRQVSMYLIKKLTTKTFAEIGKLFGGRDHSTVIHSVSKIEKLADEDDEFRALLGYVERKLQNL